METIYLDNNATTQTAPEAVEAMVAAMREGYANPSSMHRPGQYARKLVEDARGQVARLINCQSSELVLTSGGTESINDALQGVCRVRRPRNRLITSPVEHSATRGACDKLRTDGIDVFEVGVDSAGRLDMERLEHELGDDVAMVSLMWANNETGVLFDVPAVAQLCRERRIPFHCDGTQAVGKIPVDVKTAGVDLMSFSAHKFHGPKGVGGLFVRRGVRMATLIPGGPQEMTRRGGTENVPGIVGMGVAAELAARHLPEMDRVAALRDRLERHILQTIPETSVNGAAGERLPNTTNIGFARLQSEAILLLLSERGLCASAGAACSSGSLEPSHVLRAMCIDFKIAHGAIRFSLSRYTTEREIDLAMEIIPPVIQKLRTVLPT